MAIANDIAAAMGGMYKASKDASDARHTSTMEEAQTAHTAAMLARSISHSEAMEALKADAAADSAALQAIQDQFEADLADVYGDEVSSMDVNFAALVAKHGELSAAIEEATALKLEEWGAESARIGDFDGFSSGYNGEPDPNKAQSYAKAKEGYAPAQEAAAEGEE
tara:strand:+ start:64 stop:561 length:498 start_codon:yes stop_codon:yes gene_type:complete